jgi:Gas vesicle synthesis protein GvpL/GvpF
VTEVAGTVYVYGVLSASDAAALPVAGVKGSSVRTVAHGELAALVSDLDGGALTAAREVRAHWRVLEEASKDATVLPVRFGTVMESDRAVCAGLLELNAETLSGLLRDLAGRVQLSVKGDYDEEALLREVVAASPPIAALRQRVRALPDEAGYYDRIRLGELVAAEVARRRADDTRLVLDRLEPHAVATRAQTSGGPAAAFDLAFLVERDGVDAFSRAVVEVGDEVGDRIGIRYVGPLPPYSFAESDLATGAAQWA